jgi:Fe2+ or Zn2+ uptake regulation protein
MLLALLLFPLVSLRLERSGSGSIYRDILHHFFLNCPTDGESIEDHVQNIENLLQQSSKHSGVSFD